MRKKDASSPRVIFFGAFPPPINGFSVITAAIANEVEKSRKVLRVNLSSQKKNPIIKAASNLSRCAYALWILTNSLRAREKPLISIGVNGGLGQIYTAIVLCAARMCGFLIVLHHHSYKYIDRRAWLMAFICAVGGDSSIHVLLSEGMKRRFLALYPNARRAESMPNAAFVDAQPERQISAPKVIRFGMISNLTREKGAFTFLRTAEEFANRNLGATFCLAGPAGDEEVSRAIRIYQEKTSLEWLGPLYGSQKNQFFAALDVFLFPTEYLNEAQPTVIYEALAAGVPVLAYRRGAIIEQVENCLLTIELDRDFCETAVEVHERLKDYTAGEWDSLRKLAVERYRTDRESGIAALASLYLGATGSKD